MATWLKPHHMQRSEVSFGPQVATLLQADLQSAERWVSWKILQ